MIRRKQTQGPLFYAAEEIRPATNGRYDRLDAAVGDWEALAAPLRNGFSQERNGRPTDPVVYLKIFLLGYLLNISEDTELAERISDSLSIRKFLGYDLNEATPDHSSISKVRARLAGHVDAVLENVVGICALAGLVGGTECSVDSSLSKANASCARLVHLDTGETPKEYTARLRKADPKAKVSVKNREFICTTDPEARLTSKPSAPPDLYYKVTHVTDSKCQIILSAGCSTADTHDVHCASGPLKRASRTLKLSRVAMGTVVADSGYDDGNFHAFVESLGSIPLTNHYSRERKGQIPKSDFRYDAERDVYICPAGQSLKCFRSNPSKKQYRSKGSVCKDCPFKAECISKGKVRLITRYPNEEARARNLARCKTAEGKRALSRRKYVVEPPFAHMKQHGGLRRLNCRTLDRVTVKFVIGAIAWNLLKVAENMRVPAQRLKKSLVTTFFAFKCSIFAHGRLQIAA
jgi:transposase